MTIGIEVQRLFRRKKHGMEIVALEIIRQLQQSQDDNQYIVFAKQDEDWHCIKPTANLKINSESTAAYPLWEQVHLPAVIRQTKPDIIHCSANTAPLFGKTPLIITIHDVIYMESLNFAGSSYQNFGNLYRRFIVPRVAKKAAMILTVSAYEKQVIADRLQIPEEKIRVVYNGVNELFKPIRDKSVLSEFSKKHQLPGQFILHFGNTAPKKNTIGALAAYNIYVSRTKNPLPLVLTDCSREHITDLLKQIDAPGLIRHIQILDYIAFNTIPYLYNLATVFLYPSHRESFGMPVIEAMACGVPVITSNTSALPEIAGDAACLANPKKPEQIAGQLARLLNDPAFYADRQQKGFKNAERFSWKNAADQTRAIYNELGHTLHLVSGA